MTTEPNRDLRDERSTTHVDLVTTASAIRAAAAEDDLDSLHGALSRLRSDLVCHVQAERTQLSAVADRLRCHVEEGQQRLLAVLDDLVFGSDRSAEECNCLLRAAQVEALVRRQADLEAIELDSSIKS
jgi:hypothetical protein